MATVEEVKKLAALSRIKIEDAELEKFTKEFDAILAYVGQLEKLEIPTKVAGGDSSGAVGAALRKGGEAKPELRNVMREDGEPRAPRSYTEKLAEQFPAREGDALRVKQILSHD